MNLSVGRDQFDLVRRLNSQFARFFDRIFAESQKSTALEGEISRAFWKALREPGEKFPIWALADALSRLALFDQGVAG